MLKIGLTGGICSGKTFVLEIFQELGCYTIRADDIAKDIIFQNRNQIHDQIRQVFGDAVFLPDGALNKELFSKTIFDDPDKRNFINNVVHPMVFDERKRILKDLENTDTYNFFIYESALLVESNSYVEFDKIIVVYTTQEEQIHRLRQRDDVTEEEALNKIKAQFPLSEKLKIAHYIIDTSGSYEDSKKKTLETFHLMQNDLNLPGK